VPTADPRTRRRAGATRPTSVSRRRPSVLLGILVGFLFPGFAKGLKPLGDGFVNLIKMMISPIIFCTIVIGVGSVAKAAKVGKVA